MMDGIPQWQTSCSLILSLVISNSCSKHSSKFALFQSVDKFDPCISWNSCCRVVMMIYVFSRGVSEKHGSFVAAKDMT